MKYQRGDRVRIVDPVRKDRWDGKTAIVEHAYETDTLCRYKLLFDDPEVNKRGANTWTGKYLELIDVREIYPAKCNVTFKII